MDVNDVIEVFKDSIDQGDLVNAYSVLAKNLERYKHARKIKQEKLLQHIINVIEGNESMDDFSKFLENEDLSFIPYIESYEQYKQSLMDHIVYAMNRYNIKYPSYDAKRCGDL
ncbi:MULTISPECIES: hypothetical protein [Acidiplasma]|uniref:Uncharacterized protein n=2 Tax=Acidiplasma TaxID=507753 RepID=A0A0Q0VNI3_9ARCH|nr:MULTISPECIES: hypothetical protein [Acidiplasma]KJE49714.1 hypothetical protein TZ01_00970 [Acidiplasma sp. MBA-1]KPV45947.1 hypothetical protein SE19_07625 [Acidiplasma aeolicum]KQB34148.1 hypothetical protein AOG54_01280 [Acidiplasma aeolicum]KQB35040.1 hypothetical protein AOG55_08100 [Acidiplasma cupricumulans]WMT55656.1 MAG: hypothetical protein RE470_03170 [Acidiplasma sp.]